MNDERPTEIETESLPAHVAICGLRYRELSKRLSRLEYLLYSVAVLVALGEGSIAELLRALIAR